jgi:hypothetical protein
MNALILPFHAVDTASKLDLAALALTRLGVWLDDEGDGLETVLSVGSRTDGLTALKLLRSLHVGDGDHGLIATLHDAERLVADMLDAIETISTSMEMSDGTILPADHDAAVRWHGARAADALAAIRSALD